MLCRLLLLLNNKLKYMKLFSVFRRSWFGHVKEMHFKCRNAIYPRSHGVERSTVADNQVEWSVKWQEYQPVPYTDPDLLAKPWADPELCADFSPIWNTLDGTVNRISYSGAYTVAAGRPLNPRGRTGVAGRGLLGRWGPNHAADPIVTRWHRKENGDIAMHSDTLAPVLQFVAIQRRDCKEWAIPGGMVDPGELVTSTLQREFMEEALNSLEKKQEDAERIVKEFFSQGREVYRGYVDDPRNTDNAWMETVAYNFHDEDGGSVGQLPLQAGDDAQGVTWMNLGGDIKLYASHLELLRVVAQIHHAHW